MQKDKEWYEGVKENYQRNTIPYTGIVIDIEQKEDKIIKLTVANRHCMEYNCGILYETFYMYLSGLTDFDQIKEMIYGRVIGFTFVEIKETDDNIKDNLINVTTVYSKDQKFSFRSLNDYNFYGMVTENIQNTLIANQKNISEVDIYYTSAIVSIEEGINNLVHENNSGDYNIYYNSDFISDLVINCYWYGDNKIELTDWDYLVINALTEELMNDIQEAVVENKGYDYTVLFRIVVDTVVAALIDKRSKVPNMGGTKKVNSIIDKLKSIFE